MNRLKLRLWGSARWKCAATVSSSLPLRSRYARRLPTMSSMARIMAMATIKVARDVPPLPEYSEVAEFLVRRVHQAMTGEMEVKEALDTAAGEVTEHLRKRSYDPK